MSARIRTLVAALIVFPGALAAQGTGASTSDLNRDLERLAKGEQIVGVPSADSVAPGARTIPANSVVRGTVVAQGRVDVLGRIEGSVVSLGGDVIVHSGGIVTGSALAVGGRVTADSGQVLGEIRTMTALPSVLTAPTVIADMRTPAQRAAGAARVVAGTFAILLVIALGVLLFAGPNLDEVVATIQRQFARAFWYGVLGQLVVLPALLLVIVALALTVIGILLIPFAIVAYAIACAGLVTLGFLAVSRLVGGAAWHGDNATARARSLGAMAIGIAVFFTLWMVAALMVGAPLAATVVRAAAVAVTWSAMTLGLGSAIISRAGTHRRIASGMRPVELAAWQTPTPVAGVVAARRTAGAAREAR
jgi:hypothetical protein